MKKIGMIDKAFLLKKTPLFASLDLDLILASADKLGVSTWGPGEKIFSLGDEATKMYFIAKGELKIDHKTLKSPDFFGDEALFNERPRNYTVETVTETTLLTLSKTNLLTIINECPSVAVALLQARMP